MAVGGILLFFLAMYGLMPVVTRQGASRQVPKVETLTYQEAIKRLETMGLRGEVLDSQYVHDQPKGSILKQIPDPGSAVKPGRTVYLIVNKYAPPNTTLPDILDVNLQQATYVLRNWGLNVGNVTYQSGDGQDLVVAVKYGGKEIPAGTRLKQGAKVDLVVTRGYGQETVEVPNLKGRTLDEATALLNAASLSLGRVIYGKAPGNAKAGTVYDQKPGPEKGSVTEGTAIDLYIAGDRPTLIE